MNIARYRLRRWAAGLTLAAVPLLIGVAAAPTSLAQDGTGPCAWDVASLACMQYQTNGAEGVCAWDVASLACMQARTAGPRPPPQHLLPPHPPQHRPFRNESRTQD